MKFDLKESAKEHILTVAHRGISGGNIPCNTIASCEVALLQGADMLEVDITKNIDGKLFLFHPRKEPAHLGKLFPLELLPSGLIKNIHYINYDRTKTQFPICSFDDFLDTFKNRCYINIDKFWSNPKEIYDAVKRHNMQSQILVKSKMNDKVLSVLENEMPELSFMPIIKGSHPYHEKLLKSKINYVGVEALFEKDDELLASDKFIEQMHRDDILVWTNSIIFNYKRQLSGGHSDDTALTKSMDDGWGWLADKGFDIIQTDWVQMLVDYLKKTEKYYK